MCVRRNFTARLTSHLRERGVEVLEQANVTEFLVWNSSVHGVRTQADEIAADAVVIAAGVWSRELAGMLWVRASARRREGIRNHRRAR